MFHKVKYIKVRLVNPLCTLRGHVIDSKILVFLSLWIYFTIKSGWFIVFIEESLVTITKKLVFLSLKIDLVIINKQCRPC